MNQLCWQMIWQPQFTYLFGLFHLFLMINVIVTDVDVTKVRCYWPYFIYFIFILLFNAVWPGVIKPTLFNLSNGSCCYYNILIMKINDIKLNYEDQYFPRQFQLSVEMNLFPHTWGSHGRWPGKSLWYWENYCSVYRESWPCVKDIYIREARLWYE